MQYFQEIRSSPTVSSLEEDLQPFMFIDNVPDSTVMFPELRTEPRFSSITVPFCIMMRRTTFSSDVLPFTELNEIAYVPFIEPGDP